MTRLRGKNIGRNDPCPCGNGQKFKHCHGRITDPKNQPMPPAMAERVKWVIAQQKAKERQRQEQQGFGKPIISSAASNGIRIVAVGSSIRYSDKWKTVHDFLGDYLRNALGTEWGNTELAKPLADRHLILKWYDRLCAQQQTYQREPGQVSTMPATGAAAAWFQIAYDLYCLEHNAKLQTKLINRIKASDPGARYEAFVAACFLRAGFKIEFEDESDRHSSHVEFTATCMRSGKKYSVEAKHREPGDDASGQTGKFRIGRKLQRALRKDANYPRVIFIDINVPDDATDKTIPGFLQRAQNDLRQFEGRTDSRGNPLPPAYIFVTNMPFEHNLDGTQIRCAALAEGFKIPDFKSDTMYSRPLEAYRARKAHADMHQLRDSIFQHSSPPSTFDGEVPELAFGDHPPRLMIGNYYLVKDSKGIERPAKLTTATVMESESAVMGGYHFEDTDESVLCKSPLSEAELQAYKRHPETFFGVEQYVGKTITSPLEMFEFLMHGFKETPRDRLLEMLAGASDLEQLKTLTREELLEIVADRQTCSFFNQHAPMPGGQITQPGTRVPEVSNQGQQSRNS